MSRREKLLLTFIHEYTNTCEVQKPRLDSSLSANALPRSSRKKPRPYAASFFFNGGTRTSRTWGDSHAAGCFWASSPAVLASIPPSPPHKHARHTEAHAHILAPGKILQTKEPGGILERGREVCTVDAPHAPTQPCPKA